LRAVEGVSPYDPLIKQLDKPEFVVQKRQKGAAGNGSAFAGFSYLPCSSAKVAVVTSQTSEGPQY
jgi:hypothetical protein